MEQYMLSTKDNPYSPWTQWTAWYGWDEQHGYHSTALLGRFARTSDTLSDIDQMKVVSDAIDSIIALYADSPFIKIKKPESI